MEGLLLFLAGFFIITFFLGRFMEKFRIPWIFSSLIVGVFLAINNPFEFITTSEIFEFLSKMGMLFLLFIIGFDLNLSKTLEQKSFIFKSAISIILAETLVGFLFIHFAFDVPWTISLLVASSFATVGEVVLLPILEEFNLVKTRLGQSIIGIGALDDMIEIVAIIFASILIGRNLGYPHFNIYINLAILLSLFALVFLLVRFHKEIPNFKFKDIPSFFLFVMFFIFLFVGIGEFVESGSLAALLAGIALRNIVPNEKLKVIDSEIKTMAYGLFAPIFFLSVGLSLDMRYLADSIELVLITIALVFISKVGVSYLVSKKVLGKRKSIVMGVALTTKLSTSIVVLKLLLVEGLIPVNLYTVLVASTFIFTVITPFVLSNLIKLWDIGFAKIKNPQFE